MTTDWISVIDEDDNTTRPDTEQNVLVFLLGDRGMADDRPNDAAWGTHFGYFDQDKGYWRVSGSRCPYVTHWMDLPDDPPREGYCPAASPPIDLDLDHTSPETVHDA